VRADNEKFNFANVSTLIVDGDTHASEITAKLMRGFGVSNSAAVESGEEAKKILASGRQFDIVLCEAVLDDMLGADFVRWVRRETDSPLRFVPVLVLSGHTHFTNVVAARDAGANCAIKKPLSPTSLFDHVVWSASGARPFVETDTYVGPDRRFRNIGPPNGIGRRSTDLSAEIGEATEANLSQDEVDSFIKVTKVSLD
jgi:CheY-like chemotaxis protein